MQLVSSQGLKPGHSDFAPSMKTLIVGVSAHRCRLPQGFTHHDEFQLCHRMLFSRLIGPHIPSVHAGAQSLQAGPCQRTTVQQTVGCQAISSPGTEPRSSPCNLRVICTSLLEHMTMRASSSWAAPDARRLHSLRLLAFLFFRTKARR